MNKNEKFVVTINREVGSGGRTVGCKLAEKLGVAFYDKAVIKALQEKFNLSVEEIERRKGGDQGWWSEIKRMVNLGPNGINAARYFAPSEDDDNELLTTDEMFKVEKDILQNIAKEESCVIAGRSAFFVLKDHPNHLNILIQASLPFRVERMMRKQGLSRKAAEKTIEKVDKMRENYVKEYSGTSRYDTRNYNLVISADGNTEDEIVDLILQYINNTSK